MITGDRKRFVEILLGFAEIKGKQLSAPAIELYWRAMQDWEIGDFGAASEQLLRTCEFFPTPADFEKLRRAASGQSADAAWEELLHAHGECSDPAGARALRSMGGWRVIGYADIDRLPWLKERFREAYENFADSFEAQEALPQLTGPQPIRRLLGHG